MSEPGENVEIVNLLTPPPARRLAGKSSKIPVSLECGHDRLISGDERFAGLSRCLQGCRRPGWRFTEPIDVWPIRRVLIVRKLCGGVGSGRRRL